MVSFSLARLLSSCVSENTFLISVKTLYLFLTSQRKKKKLKNDKGAVFLLCADVIHPKFAFCHSKIQGI